MLGLAFDIRRACLAAALAVVSSAAVAGDITGYVTSVVTRDSDGLTYAVVAGTPSSRAACAAATSYWIVAAETTESGKKQYALLLSAKTAWRASRNPSPTTACSG